MATPWDNSHVRYFAWAHTTSAKYYLVSAESKIQAKLGTQLGEPRCCRGHSVPHKMKKHAPEPALSQCAALRGLEASTKQSTSSRLLVQLRPHCKLRECRFLWQIKYCGDWRAKGKAVCTTENVLYYYI